MVSSRRNSDPDLTSMLTRLARESLRNWRESRKTILLLRVRDFSFWVFRGMAVIFLVLSRDSFSMALTKKWESYPHKLCAKTVSTILSFLCRLQWLWATPRMAPLR